MTEPVMTESARCGAWLPGHPHPCARTAGHGGAHESVVGGTWEHRRLHKEEEGEHDA
ncbi:hypothetical protein J0910_03670 [Nocardiopsis sp. CNT-189]|uniref:hypothetical protein n=1 Tax=Nocardiopsis oceanisediminis TaxID=2816862 RepID=UPI003B300A38